VSVALIIQAILFGDGGITAIGANCFNMAVAGRIRGIRDVPHDRRRFRRHEQTTMGRRSRWAYVSLNVSALLTAVQLGIQPLLERTPDGQPLYSPFPLSFAVPAIAMEHLLLFGFVEAAVTALVIRYFQKNDPEMLA